MGLPVILALRRLRHEDGELEASLGYRVRPHCKQINKQKCRKISGIYNKGLSLILTVLNSALTMLESCPVPQGKVGPYC
jgi:hypothetical protein